MELLTYHSLLISKTRQQFPGCNHIPKQLQHQTENQIPVTQTASKKNPTFIFLLNFMLPRFLTSTGSITSVTAHQVRSITSELQLRSDEGYFSQTLLTGLLELGALSETNDSRAFEKFLWQLPPLADPFQSHRQIKCHSGCTLWNLSCRECYTAAGELFAASHIPPSSA